MPRAVFTMIMSSLIFDNTEQYLPWSDAAGWRESSSVAGQGESTSSFCTIREGFAAPSGS